jgi:hypothetical protein
MKKIFLLLTLLLVGNSSAAWIFESTFAEIDSVTMLGLNKPYFDAHQAEIETLTVVAGTPESPVKATLSKDQDSTLLWSGFDVIGGHFTYIDSIPRHFSMSFAGSITTSANNVIVSFCGGLNGVPIARSRISRKVQTGADVGSVSGNFTITLKQGDYVDIFIDTDGNTDVYLLQGLYSILAID